MHKRNCPCPAVFPLPHPKIATLCTCPVPAGQAHELFGQTRPYQWGDSLPPKLLRPCPEPCEGGCIHPSRALVFQDPQPPHLLLSWE
jgi:hypothetical protein